MPDYKKFDAYDDDGFQTVFTVSDGNGGVAPETREERLLRWEKSGSYDPDCGACEKVRNHPTLSPFAPGHRSNSFCRSGKRNHCTCDSCF